MRFDKVMLGRMEYSDAYRIQKNSVAERNDDTIGDVLIFAEHPPVITVGRKGISARKDNILVSEETLKEKGIEVFEVDRGGDITLHCPGQLVCYPVIKLKGNEKDLHKYLRKLEEVIIKALYSFNIYSARRKEKTGVWVGHRKIASIGIGVANWVTCHGLSLNVSPRMEYFSLINSCGYKGIKMTSMAEQMQQPPSLEQVLIKLYDCFEEVFTSDNDEGKISILDKKNYKSAVNAVC